MSDVKEIAETILLKYTDGNFYALVPNIKVAQTRSFSLNKIVFENST